MQVWGLASVVTRVADSVVELGWSAEIQELAFRVREYTGRFRAVWARPRNLMPARGQGSLPKLRPISKRKSGRLVPGFTRRSQGGRRKTKLARGKESVRDPNLADARPARVGTRCAARPKQSLKLQSNLRRTTVRELS